MRAVAERAEADASRTLHRSTRLAQLLKILGEETDLQRLSDRTVCEIAELFGADITLLLVGRDDALWVNGSWGVRAKHIPTTTIDLSGQLPDGVCIGPASETPLPSWLSPYGLVHLAWARLSIRGESKGLLMIGRRSSEPFGTGDAQELRAMATRIAVAIDNRILQRKMAEQLERLGHLYSLTTDLAAALDLSLAEVCEAVVERIGADPALGGVALYLPGPDARLRLAAASAQLAGLPHAIDLGRLSALDVTRRALPLRHGSWESGAVVVERMPPEESDAHSLLAHIVELAGLVVDKALLYDRARRQALLDSLTDLPNRALLTQRLDAALARAERLGTEVGVIFLDLDRFKVINDSLGHGAGDGLLVQVARRLRAAARSSDTVARLGGDEFVVLCENLQAASDASVIAQRMAAAVSDEPIVVQGTKVSVTTSQGIALTTTSGLSAEALLRDADTAMYRAKEKGRNRCEVFDEELRSDALARLGVERELREAIEERRLRVLFQPIVSIPEGRIEGAEALLRYARRDGSLVAPSEFLAVAEESGLIVALDSWVLSEACRQAVLWQGIAGRPVSIGVNVAAAHSAREDFAAEVAGALSDAGLAPERLNVEVTEAALMESEAATVANLETLGKMGVCVGIDDFGTGYSSLGRLKRLPVSFLKVDRSFVDGLAPESEDIPIVQAVLGLADAMGLRVVAEGVETSEQLEELSRLGCHLAQGYFFAKPLPPKEMERLLTTDGPLRPGSAKGPRPDGRPATGAQAGFAATTSSRIA